jgi:hypothetical protein
MNNSYLKKVLAPTDASFSKICTKFGEHFRRLHLDLKREVSAMSLLPGIRRVIEDSIAQLLDSEDLFKMRKQRLNAISPTDENRGS